MDSINSYTINCTPEQTKKAFELGAPIETQEFVGDKLLADWCYDITTNFCYRIPTAEQMIGWQEEQGIIREICIFMIKNTWTWDIIDKNDDFIERGPTDFCSRKEATHAAIDAALEYLHNNKK